MKSWIRPEIDELTAYHVPDPGRWIKLDAMENPYSWPESLQQQWLESLQEVELNRYPDPAARELVERLRRVVGVPAGAGVVLGNGSDELIQLLLLTVAAPGRVVLAPEPTFVMYRMIARFTGMEYVGVPLQSDFTLDREEMMAAIDRHQPAVIFLARPNNPTGNLFEREAVTEIIENAPGFVVVDEAYHVFADDSFLEQLSQHHNLLLMRTLSKMGLAGLRLGLMAGAPEWIEQIDKVRLPYNINSLTQQTVDFILQHDEVLERQAREIRQQRHQLAIQLDRLPGVEVYPSDANFLLFRVAAGEADRIFEQLKRDGVLIKNLSSAGGLLQDTLRVTVGTPEECQTFIERLQPLL